MARVNFEIPHRLSRDEARDRIKGAISRLESDYHAKCHWEGDMRLIVSRKGLKAALDVEENRVLVDLELGILLGALGGSIRSGIVRQLTDLLA